MKQLKNIFKFSAVVMLIAVMALTFISCSKEKEDNTTPGEITITVEVINKAGESKEHEIKTTGTTLADALLEAGLVEGTTDEYGLYITTVDGELADYSADQSYWGTCDPVSGSISDSVKDFHRTEPDPLHQEILPGYGICILYSDIKCDNPAFY